MIRSITIEKKILILYGGRSGEHEVSLLSAASVIRHISVPKEKVILVGITLDGEWLLQGPHLFDKVRNGADLVIGKGEPVLGMPGKGLFVRKANGVEALEVSVVFPVLHGTFGEDGTLQGYLDILDLPYVGSGVLGSALGMDKATVKCVWRDAGLPVVPFTILHSHEYKPGSEYLLWNKWTADFKPPLFIKPARGGSSVGICKVAAMPELARALQAAFAFDTKLIIEPSVDAREIEVSVTGNEVPRAYVPGEVIPSHQFYDYDAKYLDPDGARLQVPAEIDEEQQMVVRSLAVRAYVAADACGLSRVDFFMEKDSGRFILNEINTMPGFTSISMFPMMCEANGLAYGDLIDELIELGLKEWTRRNHLRFRR